MRYELMRAVYAVPKHLIKKEHYQYNEDLSDFIDQNLANSLSKAILKADHVIDKEFRQNDIMDIFEKEVGVIAMHPEDFKLLVEERNFYKEQFYNVVYKNERL